MGGGIVLLVLKGTVTDAEDSIRQWFIKYCYGISFSVR